MRPIIPSIPPRVGELAPVPLLQSLLHKCTFSVGGGVGGGHLAQKCALPRLAHANGYTQLSLKGDGRVGMQMG